MKTNTELASMLDILMLEPGLLLADIESFCNKAIEYSFAAVCLPPLFAKKAAAVLKDSHVTLTGCIGFPTGYQATEAKLAEIVLALVDGVNNVELLINYTAIKNTDWNYAANEINHLLPLVRNAGKSLTVVLETGKLQRQEIIKCCELYSTAEVDMISATTGLSGFEPSLELIGFMREIIPGHIPVKTCLTNPNLADIELLKNAGASRIGCAGIPDFLQS